MITETKRLNNFLSSYDIKPKELADMSGQCPQTLRNWYSGGSTNSKSDLILCLIAAYKWREHHLRPIKSEIEFLGEQVLGDYLKKFDMKPMDLMYVSNQSNATLLNWLDSPQKFMLIDILIDAVSWYRYALEKNLIKQCASPASTAFVLMQPISYKQETMEFKLTKYVKHSDRLRNNRKKDQQKRWVYGHIPKQQ